MRERSMKGRDDVGDRKVRSGERGGRVGVTQVREGCMVVV